MRGTKDWLRTSRTGPQSVGRAKARTRRARRNKNGKWRARFRFARPTRGAALRQTGANVTLERIGRRSKYILRVMPEPAARLRP